MTPTFEDKERGVTLYCGDSSSTSPVLGVDCVITDPPYGVEFRCSEWDKEIPPFAFNIPKLYNRAAIIMAPVAAYQFPTPKWVACWARPASSSRSLVGGFNHWSPVLLYGDCKMSVDFRSWHAIANAYEHGFEHPSPKPECLMVWLVNELTQEGETVLDPYMGSGTTGIACLRTGRKFIGIEIDPKYYQIAEDRIKRELAQLVLL